MTRWLLCLSLLLLALAPGRAQEDPLEFSFAVMGGCRMGYHDWLAQRQQNPSSANLAQLRQNFSDMAAMDPLPELVFLTGDIVDNLADDQGQTLKAQLDAWLKVARATPVWGIARIVAIPGNHEVLRLIPVKGEVPNPACYPIWGAWVKAAGLDPPSNGPPLGGPDHLVGDQRRSSYSFDHKGVHFVLADTDSLTDEIDPDTHLPFIGWIPSHWLRGDFQAAQDNPQVKSIFMLGHKPLDEIRGGEEHSPIVNTEEWNLADQLRHTFHASSKFRAYLTGHEHLWQARRLGPPGAPWQVIIGNGGSKLAASWVKKGHPYFGFTVVRVYASGKIGLVNYQRPVPTPYFGPTEPAHPAPERILFP